MRPGTRLVLAAVAAANLALALGFAFQAPWALGAWPWETGRLSYLFIGSILAAIAAGTGWVAVSGETGSLAAGFLDLAVTLGGIAGVLALGGSVGLARPWLLAALVGVLAVANLALFVWAYRKHPPTGPRLPRLPRASVAAFTVILFAVGGALALGVPGVMPWPVDGPMGAVIGWIFLGNAFFFLYASLRPHWDATRAQLWSFLAYDVVLLGPLLAHYPAAPPELRLNVVIYVAVLVYSGALAAYYLILNPRTRGWRRPLDAEPAWTPTTS